MITLASDKRHMRYISCLQVIPSVVLDQLHKKTDVRKLKDDAVENTVVYYV